MFHHLILRPFELMLVARAPHRKKKRKGPKLKHLADVSAKRAEFANILPTYERRVLPVLQGRERQRKTRVLLAAILTLILGAGLVYVFYGPPHIVSGASGIEAMLAPVGLLVFALGPGAIILNKFSKSIKADFAIPLIESIGWRFIVDAPEPLHFPAYMHFKMLPRFDRKSFEDRIFGHHNGAYFEMVEMHLEVAGKNSYHTVFRGFALMVDFHQEFASTTVVLRDRKLLNRKKLHDLKRVGMASSKWEKLFEAYSSDQVEARVKLDPAFMERLMELETSVEGRNIRFAFFDSRLHVICETSDRFEAGSMLQPLDSPQRLQNLIDEMDSLAGVIEGVKKNTPRSLRAERAAADVQKPRSAAPQPQSDLPGYLQPNPYL